MRLGFALTVAAIYCVLSSPALAAGEARHPHKQAWSFAKPLGGFDQASVQRGYQVYEEVCSACHSLHALSYRNLGEKGGPFAAYEVRNHETGAPEVQIGPSAHGGKFISANDNPALKAIAAKFDVSEIDGATGDVVQRPARPADRFASPFANEAAARASNGGAYPPDLSVINRARHGGADYLYALMTGYGEAPLPGIEEVPGKYYNPYFRGGWIAMPPPLVADRVTYADGTPATPDQMARDVATFLEWAGDPKAELRKQMGIAVLGYLLALTVLLFFAYRQIWRGVKH
jgi:ubiquinol-cytochrome c reductase cytochrome c1 subunit